MTPHEVTISVLVVSVIIGGVTALNIFLKHRIDIRKAELESKDKELLHDGFKTLSEEDTKRQALMINAIKSVASLALVAKIAA